MTANCRELWPIESLATRTDDDILRIWDELQSGRLQSDDEWLRALAHETWRTRSLVPTIDFHQGELHLPIAEEDMRLIDQGSQDPWVRPDPTRVDFSYILGYAQSFAGYDYAEKEGIDLGNFADEHSKEYFKAGDLPKGFVHLRCCLFYEIRRQRHAGLREHNLRYIQDLYRAICSAYAAEVPPATS